MPDRYPAEVRSRTMARVRSKDTRPEMAVRQALYRLGYRYRLHRSDLPGKPDLAFASRRKVLFVNGCFWHMHSGCPRARIPQNNRTYWKAKLERNRLRDSSSVAALQNLGWKALDGMGMRVVGSGFRSRSHRLVLGSCWICPMTSRTDRVQEIFNDAWGTCSLRRLAGSTRERPGMP